MTTGEWQRLFIWEKEAFMETSRKTINVVAALIRDDKRVLPQPEDMGIIKAGGNSLEAR